MQKNFIPHGYFMCCAFPEHLHMTVRVSDPAPIALPLCTLYTPLYGISFRSWGNVIPPTCLPSCQDWTKRNVFALCTPRSFSPQCIYAPRTQGIPLNTLAMKEAKKAFDIHHGQFNRLWENSTNSILLLYIVFLSVHLIQYVLCLATLTEGLVLQKTSIFASETRKVRTN